MSLEPQEQDSPGTFLSLSARTPPSSPSVFRTLPFVTAESFSPRESLKQETLDIETSLSLQQPSLETVSYLPESFTGQGDEREESPGSALGLTLQEKDESCFEGTTEPTFLKCSSHREGKEADDAEERRDGIESTQDEIEGSSGFGEYCNLSQRNTNTNCMATPSFDLTNQPKSLSTAPPLDLANQPKSPPWLGLVEQKQQRYRDNSSFSPLVQKPALDPSISENQRNEEFSRFLMQTSLKLPQTYPTQNNILSHSNLLPPTHAAHPQSPERRTISTSPLQLRGHLQSSSDPHQSSHISPDIRKSLSPQASTHSKTAFAQALLSKESNALAVVTSSSEEQVGSLEKVLEESRMPLAEQSRPQLGSIGESAVVQGRLQDLFPERRSSEGTSEQPKSSIVQSSNTVAQHAPSVLHDRPAMVLPEMIVASSRFCHEGISKEDSPTAMKSPLAPAPLQLHCRELIYPAPLASHAAVLEDKKLFMETLENLHSVLGLHAENLKNAEGDIDLHKLYKGVTSRGGIEKVIKEGKWREVIQDLDLPATSVSVLRRCLSILHHYEQVYFHGAAGKLVPSSGAAVEQEDARLCQQRLDELERTQHRNHAIIDSAHALGVDPASSIGTVVTGAIDGKFENGYLVTVMVGARRMRGVLYHVASTNTAPQNACIPAMVQNVGLELKSTHSVPTSGRKRRKTEVFRKDPNAPRQNRTGYNFFFAEQRAKLKTTQPDKDRAISKMIGELWNKLSEDEKYPYQAKGVKDKERYVREMKEYKERTKLSTVSNEITKTPKALQSSLVRVSEASHSSNAAMPEKIQESVKVVLPHLSTSSLQMSPTVVTSIAATFPLPPEGTCKLASESRGSAVKTLIMDNILSVSRAVSTSLSNAGKEASELGTTIANVPEQETVNSSKSTVSTGIVQMDTSSNVNMENAQSHVVNNTVYDPGHTI